METMRKTPQSYTGVVTAPHHLAAQAGRDILAMGGTAVEATIAMAATLAVVYPHMTGIGGDGFWLIARNGEEPRGIDASGAAVTAAKPEFYSGMKAIPSRGVLAANTVAGTVGGWSLALELSSDWQKPLPVSTLIAAAIRHARTGFAVSSSQAELTQRHLADLSRAPGFSDTFLHDGVAPRIGAKMFLPRLAETLSLLADDGFCSFYRGKLADRIAADMKQIGGLVTGEDLASAHASEVAPLKLGLRDGARLFNLGAPTQGMASLAILGIFDALCERDNIARADSFLHVHGVIEATKRAFLLRDALIGEPGLSGDLQAALDPELLLKEADVISASQAARWPNLAQKGDTVWCGAIDSQGNMTSFIQSIFFEFGSGVVLPGTGITWQNRGSSFHLHGDSPRLLAPGRKPFHTLNPAFAILPDGRRLSYGTMGGEGQPQTQAAIFTRYANFAIPLQEAISRPRWLLGKTWGDEATNLKCESDLCPETIEELRNAGHDLQVISPLSDTMGHAGALVLHPNGMREAASDPRSDGAAVAI